MKKRIRLIAACLIISIAASAQPLTYDAASVPANLKEGAHVVKRFEDIRFDVKDIDKASLSIHQVYTILDEDGSDRLFFAISTYRLLKIDEVEIKMYDAAGRTIGRYKKKDLSKQASMEGLVDDGMYHFLRLATTSYPVTVEYDYTMDFSGTLQYPAYKIQLPGESVEYSSFTASVPTDLDLRYMEQKISLKPEVSYLEKKKVYKWQVKNAVAFKDEEGSVQSSFYIPSIILGPNKFRHFNTNGDMSTWKAFGQWGYELLKGLEELPEERKQYFVNLVKNAASDREKVAIIYRYLQQNFRYVSIQLGIGGVKPFPAKFTDEKKYGDCKGLSLYMSAALKAVGIKSYSAFINAKYNQEAVAENFPCDRFDHVILCVPQAKDSIWLECTSNTAEFAVLGSFTENKRALLLTESGGVLVSTPSSRAANNIMNSSTTIRLNEDGSGKTLTNISTRGEFRDALNYMVTAKKDDQKKMIVRYFGFKQPDEFSVVKRSQDTELDVDIDLSIEKIPQFTAGSKMFLNPRVYSIWKTVLPKAENRNQDYLFESPFIRTDTTIYVLPAEYVAESVPSPLTLTCPYGTYTTSYNYSKENNQLMSIARLELNQSRIPAAKYSEVKKFFDSVISDDGQKLVIKKN